MYTTLEHYGLRWLLAPSPSSPSTYDTCMNIICPNTGNFITNNSNSLPFRILYNCYLRAHCAHDECADRSLFPTRCQPDRRRQSIPTHPITKTTHRSAPLTNQACNNYRLARTLGLCFAPSAEVDILSWWGRAKTTHKKYNNKMPTNNRLKHIIKSFWLVLSDGLRYWLRCERAFPLKSERGRAVVYRLFIHAATYRDTQTQVNRPQY